MHDHNCKHGAEHNHSHSHVHGGEINEKNLFISIILNLVITLAEFIGGILSNSLALLSDAIHNFSDSFSMLASYISIKIGKKEPGYSMTFGYKRIEILAALFNSFTLALICIFIIYKAIVRFIQPEPIESNIMLWVATIGLVANLISVLLLFRDKQKSINIKSAYLHLLGDTLSSVIVIIGAVFINIFKIYWLDPVLTILISGFIFKETFGLLKQTYSILMQSTPKGVEIEDIKREIECYDQVLNAHHIHVWNYTDSSIFLECHIDFKDNLKISEIDEIRLSIADKLMKKYAVSHVTIQPEFDCCKNKSAIGAD